MGGFFFNRKMRYIDTHTHLYTEEFDPDRNQVMQAAIDAGVTKMVMPAIDTDSHKQLIDLADKWPGVVFPAMGVHPTSINIDYKQQLDAVEQYLAQRHFCAIGEIGTDFYWDTTFATQQIDAFTVQLRWAIDANKPVIIHTRNSMDETLKVLETFVCPQLRGILHCFSGTAEQAKKAIEMGFLIGIGGVLTFKKSDTPNIVNEIGIDHLVLETDSPYLTPVPFRGSRNESKHIPVIAQKLAEVLNVSVEKVAEVTTKNAENLFGI